MQSPCELREVFLAVLLQGPALALRLADEHQHALVHCITTRVHSAA